MKKSTIFLAIIVLIISFLAIYYLTPASPTQKSTSNTNSDTATPANNNSNSQQLSQDQLVSLAKQKFQEFKSDGEDMSNGPCLGQIADDWVADIAHNPRQDIDNDIFNECSDYIYGRAHHFVELDTDGNLIRVN